VLIGSTSRSWKLFNTQGDTWVLDSSVDVTWSASTLQVDKTSVFNNMNCFLGISLEHLWKSFSFDLVSVETNCSTSVVWRRRRVACVQENRLSFGHVCSVKSKPAARCTVSGRWEWTSRTHQRTWMQDGCRVVTVVGYVLTLSHASTNPSSHQALYPFTLGTRLLP
jgi:hypothetical protein